MLYNELKEGVNNMKQTEIIEELLLKYKEWLKEVKHYTDRTISSRVSNVRTLNNNYDLLSEFANDECVGILDELTFSKNDIEPKTSILIKGDYYTGLATYKQALLLFIVFLKDIKYVHYLASPIATSYYEGNFDDFKKYVGPKCRNEVNLFCKAEREKHNGICEYCGRKGTLDSAHRIERPVIMKEILEKNYKIGVDNYRVNLQEFFVKFKNSHFPIRDNIFFLCKTCHDNLDKKGLITIKDIENKRNSI